MKSKFKLLSKKKLVGEIFQNIISDLHNFKTKALRVGVCD